MTDYRSRRLPQMEVVIDSAAVMPAEASRRLGLVPRDYASLFVTRTSDGQRLTLIGPDLAWLELFVSAGDVSGWTVPWHKFPVVIERWPDEWAQRPDEPPLRVS